MAKIGVAPRAGAWIEICKIKYKKSYMESLPARERGLKLLYLVERLQVLTVAPRAGAWIEIML